MRQSRVLVVGGLILLALSQLGAKEAHHTTTTHWGYMGESSPAHWGDLSEKFKTCKEGREQSPINIVPTKDTKLEPLNLNYSVGAKSIINNGHSIQINIKDGNIFKVDGKTYKLKQFHFHVPSENNIKGDAFPLEAHFVHVSDDGEIAVIGVMFKEGEKNRALQKIWKNISELDEGKELESDANLYDIKALMPEEKSYYRFKGSLTTPPCSENVKWFLFKTPLTVSKEQINSFFNQFSFPNNRPIQPTNGREILE